MRYGIAAVDAVMALSPCQGMKHEKVNWMLNGAGFHLMWICVDWLLLEASHCLEVFF